MATFSFEEGLSPDTGGTTPFVPASRTKQRTNVLDPADFTAPATSDKQGTLPSDPSVQSAIMDAAKEFNVPPEYALALADQESGYNPNAHNDEYGADGMFQFIPATATGHGLKYGVDTRDPVKSARAAMKDFSEQMAVGGTDWAIKYHFAGPNAKEHGPKTSQYLADVNKRADDIRRLLADPSAPVSTASTKPAGPKTFSFEEGYGPTLGSKPPVSTQNKPVEAGWQSAAVSFLGNSSEALQNAAKGTFDFVWQRLKDGPDEYLGKKLVKVERSPQEIQDLLDEQNKHWYSTIPKAGEEGFRQAHRYQIIPQGDDTDLINQRKNAKPEEQKAGFFPNIKNIFQLLTTDSLPANFAETLAQAPEHARQNFWKARQVAMQENIVQHPEQFPEVAVQAAQGAINARRNTQPMQIRQMWDQLKGAAKEDPGRFGAQFANAIIADPEMLLAPEGLGTKVISSTRKVVTGVETISKAAKIADRVVDAGSTGAALNMGMEAASKASEGQEVTGQDMGFAAATGFGIAGPLGAIFGKGAVAREKFKSGNVSPDDLEGFMRDAARDDIATEDVVNGNVPDDVKTRIEKGLGIDHMSDAEKKAWHNKRQRELTKTFADQSEEANYQKFKAEERILRTQQLAEDAAAKQQAEARSASVESAYVAHREQIRAQYEDDWHKALAARDQAANAQDHSEALHENTLRDATSKLDEQEIIDGAYQGSSQVRDAMLRAAQRDAKLRVPKWQRGEVDPRLIARLGIGSLFAGTAYAVAPEDSKMGAGFAAGLAGLLIPGGGRVLDRMRQSGMVSSEGDIIGLLVEKGKLKPDVDVQQARLAEAEQIGRAKRGDQTAYKKLYEDNFPRIKRFAKQYVREAGPKLGIDAEDVAQNTFIQAFKNLDKFNGTSGFYTWLYAIAKNEGLQAIREAQNLKGGGQYNITSMHAPSRVDAPGDLGAGHLEGGNSSIKGEVEGAAADIDTPEGMAIQEEVKQQLSAAIAKLPEKQREIFLLNRVEQYTAQEIADMKSVSINSVLSDIKRAQDSVTAALEKGYSAKPVVAQKSSTAKVLYHGTDAHFDSFKGGTFFSDEPSAKAYADYRKGKVYKAEVDIKKPASGEDVAKAAKKVGIKEDMYDAPWQYLTRSMLKDHQVDAVVAELKKQGFDGAHFTDDYLPESEKNIDSWVPFDSKQIRNLSNELPKRGRGRPKLQRGEVDPKLLLKITGVAGTAALGAYLVDNSDGKHSKTTAALGGAALGLLLFGGRGGGLRSAIDMIDNATGVASTRLLNASPKIFRRAQNAERRILETTHINIGEVDPFLVRLSKLPKEGQQVVTRALLTGHSGVISRVLQAMGDPELTAGYARVRAVLDSLGDTLVQLNRFKKGAGEYFPRIVKDREGLFKAIGKQDSDSLKDILTNANAESIRKNGRPLSQIEESALINQTLFVDKRSTQPGWSKNRGIEEITPELLQYYATPAESVHTYIRSAVQDIEKAKFFGRYAKNMPKGQFEFLDTDRSINNMLAEEIKSGDLTHEHANEIADILKARFGKGEMSESDLIRNIKNVGNIGLLGNLWSASSQLADVALQVHVQSLTSTLRAVSKQLTGRSIIGVKDFGLIDHISEEFANQLKTTKWFNTFAKVSLFSGMDKFGKNTALNAAIIRAKTLASSDRGQVILANKYQDMFGNDFQKLVSELKSGKITDLTKEYAWLELSRTQPISRLEMPVAYLNNPQLRSFWWLKSFTLKQFDLLRRDAYNEIKKGNYAKGMKNLVSAGVAMGVGGAGTQVVKDWMLGRDPKLDLGEIPLNMFRNLGFSQYTLDHLTGMSKEEAAARRAGGDANARAQRAAPLEAIADIVAPPYKQFQDILTGNPRASRYLVPIVGPYVAERIRNSEIERKKIEKEQQ